MGEWSSNQSNLIWPDLDEHYAVSTTVESNGVTLETGMKDGQIYYKQLTRLQSAIEEIKEQPFY